MTSSKFFTLSLFIIATIATTSPGFVHGALGLPMGLHPLPNPFEQTAEPNTAKGLQLAIKQTQTLHGYQVQLTHAQKLLDEAEIKRRRCLTDDEQDANNKYIDDMQFTIQQLNAKIAQGEQAQEHNEKIIQAGMNVTDDPTTNAVVEAMYDLSDLNLTYGDELKKQTPNDQNINNLLKKIQDTRQIIFGGLRKGIYFYGRSSPTATSKAVLTHAVDTNNVLVTQYCLESHSINPYQRDDLLRQALKENKPEIAEIIIQKPNNIQTHREPRHIIMNPDYYTAGETLKTMIRTYGLDPNAILQSALHAEKPYPLIPHIIDAGADPRSVEFLLHRAAHRQDLELLQCLLKKGLDLNAKDDFNNRPIDHTVYKTNDPDVTRKLKVQAAVLLVQAGANKIRPNSQLRTDPVRRTMFFDDVFEAYEKHSVMQTAGRCKIAANIIQEAARQRALTARK